MMSDRERWIVYPLLTLALALGAKGRWDAWRGVSEFNVLTCRRLVVRNELDETTAAVLIEQNPQGAAEFSLAGAEGLVELSLLADEGGGRIVLVRREDGKAIVLGHDKLREISGLWAMEQGSAGPPAPVLIETGEDNVWEVLPWPTEKTNASGKANSNEETSPADAPAEEAAPNDAATPDASTSG